MILRNKKERAHSSHGFEEIKIVSSSGTVPIVQTSKITACDRTTNTDDLQL